MRREAERLAQKHRGQFRDDLLARIGRVAKLREPEITVQSMGGFRGMGQLMGPDPVKIPRVWAHNKTEKPGTSAEAIDFMQQF